MITKVKTDSRQAESGQALVLGAGSMLILALMLMFSMNISQALHEKIRIQNFSDAQAYSMAVVEARTFNYIAYTNRAMAAAYVSAMSLHAYMSAVSAVPAMSTTAAYNFFVMAGIEFALCCACTYCVCVQHCIEGVENIFIAFDYLDEADSKADDVKDLESSFRLAMRMLELMINTIHASQLSSITRATDVLMGKEALGPFQSTLRGTAGAEVSTDTFYAPHATELPTAVGLLNVREFACAIEEPPLLSFAAFGCPSVDTEHRAKVMTEVANGTRPSWPAERPFFPYHIGITWLLSDFMTDIPDDGMSIPLMHDGTAKLIDDTSTSQLEDGKQGRTGTTIGADEHGLVFSWKDHAAMILPYSASIFSDKDGGDHSPSDAHEDQHDFDGVNAADGFSCLFNNNCFIKYRAVSKKSKDWGQPSVYSFTSQDLTIRGAGANVKNPWEITDSGTLSITHGSQGEGEVTLKPGTGLAMSKALVYYHRLGDWKEQPNLFNPYWRAKLHPFGALDAALVLGAAGEGQWAAVAGIGQVPLN